MKIHSHLDLVVFGEHDETDLVFAYSLLSKFVQYPGVVHLQAAERVLQYVRGTYDQGMTLALKSRTII